MKADWASLDGTERGYAQSGAAWTGLALGGKRREVLLLALAACALAAFYAYIALRVLCAAALAAVRIAIAAIVMAATSREAAFLFGILLGGLIGVRLFVDRGGHYADLVLASQVVLDKVL